MKVKKWYLTVIMAVIATVCTAFIAACDKPEEEPTSDGSENGIYYYDAATEEYTLTLNTNKFEFHVDGDDKSGVYSIQDNALSFTFADGGSMSATLNGDSLKVSYNSAEMTFLKKISYTVSFEVNGGSAVSSQSVVNGKSAIKPADPTKSGYAFLGWYADAQFNTAYTFGEVKSDVKVYAKWLELVPGEHEFTVSYDLGYEGASLASQSTVGGKLYNVPVPERSGYTFGGWWISQYGDGNKLSYAYTDGMEIKENLTLYAVWKAADSKAPVVSIDGDNVKWNRETGTSYKIEVTGPDGFVAINEEVNTGVKAVFANAPAGEYVITVTATSGSKSESTKLYYKLKALDRVSVFSVTESVLTFNAVDHAEKYLITVECGSEEHNHVSVDNGALTSFNFANCAMKVGGIKFTVTAIAEGYASSVSESFVFDRVLGKVAGLKIDEATQSVAWDSVEGATSYVVTVKQGEDTKTIDNGNKTSVNLKNYGKGEIVITVTPKNSGYNSPEASEIKYDKKTLAAPDGIKLNGTVLEWNAVAGATGYDVLIGGETVSVSEGTSTDLFNLDFTEGNYTVTVLAKGASAAENSAWSDGIEVSFNANLTGLAYSKNEVSWSHVLGAVKYEVKVNGETVKVIDDGANSAEIVLTKQGVNEIEVRYSNGSKYSDWAKIEVTAYAVTFDTRSTAGEITQYVATGDKLSFPAAEKTGYDLSGWNNSDGAKFEDEYFNGDADISLDAIWTGKKYTVTYSYGEDKTGTKEVVFGDEFSLIAPESDDAAYVFGGWYDENGKRLTDGNGASLDVWNVSEDTTVYIRWFNVLSFSLLQDGTYSVSKGPDIGFVKEIAIPENYEDIAVTEVNGYAFQNCTLLEKVSFYDTVKLVDDTAFEYCYGLKEINVIPVSGNNEAVYSSVDGALIYHDADITGDHILKAFPMAKTGKYTVPEIVTVIPSGVFYDCAIEELVIPASATKINANAFQTCRKLEKITFLSGEAGSVVAIDANAFSGCSSLKEINLSANVAAIDIGIFNGCGVLEKVNVDESNANYSSVDGVLLNKDGTELIFYPVAHGDVYSVPVNVSKIGENAFKGSDIKEVTISSTVTSIDKSAFENCELLEKVTFANSGAALDIGDTAFKGCESLGAIEIPARLSSLGLGVFDYCDSLVNFTVAADSEKYSAANGILVEKVGDDAVVKFVLPSQEGEYVLPDTVTKIENGTFGGLNITKITIGKGVKEIGESAFANCTSLEDVVFAEDGALTTIGASAFEGCTALKGIAIPATVTSLGEKAFYNCYELATLTFGESIRLETIKANTFSTNMLSSANKLTEVIIPASVKVVENNAFYRNHELATLTFAEGSVLETVGEGAFGGSTASNGPAYTELVLPATVKTIGKSAFQYSDITSIIIPANVTDIGDRAFQNTKLTSVTFAAGDKDLSIGSYAFASTPLEEVTIPARLKEFDESTFDSDKLANINVDPGHELFSSVDGVLFDKEGASILFYPANHGAEYVLPDSVTTVSAYFFSMNNNLTKITFGANIKAIEECAFMSCSKLEEVIFLGDGDAEGVSIGDTAFYNCQKLKSINLPANLTSLGQSAFQSCTSLTEITIPKNLKSFSMDVFTGCTSLKTINIDPENEFLKSEGGNLYSDGGKTLMMWASTEKKAVIPEGVTKIADSAFASCEIEEVEFPASVTSIGAKVFQLSYPLSSKLTKVTFAADSQLESIGDYAFAQCSSLTKIELPASLKTIGQYAFYSSTKLATVTFAEGSKLEIIQDRAFNSCSALTAIEIPAGVVKIGQRTFQSCRNLATVTFAEGSKLVSIEQYTFASCAALTSIVIPKTVTGLGNYAFNSCNELASVTFEEGTQLSSIGERAFSACWELTELVIPESVRTIGNYAFNDCYNIEKITFLGVITSMGSYVFNYWGNEDFIQVVEFVAMTEPNSGWNSYWEYGYDDEDLNIIWKSAE